MLLMTLTAVVALVLVVTLVWLTALVLCHSHL